MLTLSEENYLKAIYHLGRFGNNSVNTNAIAEQMETKASSVTDMIKKLAEKELLHYKKYQGAKLTKKGLLKAALIIRKHRLWEVFLVEKLNFKWDEVHEIAEQLEHIKSEQLIDRLEAFLEFPTQDPHGDPIPDKNGHTKTIDKSLLSELKLGSNCTLVSIKDDSSKEFLKYLDKNGLTLGTRIKLISKEKFDNSMTLLLNNKNLNISKLVSDNLFVKVI